MINIDRVCIRAACLSTKIEILWRYWPLCVYSSRLVGKQVISTLLPLTSQEILKMCYLISGVCGHWFVGLDLLCWERLHQKSHRALTSAGFFNPSKCCWSIWIKQKWSYSSFAMCDLMETGRRMAPHGESELSLSSCPNTPSGCLCKKKKTPNTMTQINMAVGV